jgi:Ca-activated chloride channel family protein
MKRLGFILLWGVSVSLPVHTAAAAWIDWWKTPEQQALEAFDQGDHDTLINHAPDADWHALGQYQAGDYDAASARFAEVAQQRELGGDTSGANRARYNRGVSEVRAGRYQQAIDQFDAVLDADPGFVDAAYNRTIAERLKRLEEQQQQNGAGESPPDPQGDESGEQSGEGESGDGTGQTAQDPGGQQDGGQSDAQANQQQARSGDSATDENNDAQQGGSSGEDGQRASAAEDDSQVAQSAEQQARDEEQARQALAAEARQQAQNRDTGNAQGTADSVVSSERPLTENEQAAEQLLRRIPDDPAGLLRRKLEQSHLNEYPDVRDSNEPW